jgi:hypothetical protein
MKRHIRPVSRMTTPAAAFDGLLNAKQAFINTVLGWLKKRS